MTVTTINRPVWTPPRDLFQKRGDEIARLFLTHSPEPGIALQRFDFWLNRQHPACAKLFANRLRLARDVISALAEKDSVLLVGQH